MNYTHQELGLEVEAISGYYTPERELRLAQSDREVLCIIGRVNVEASCCGSRNWRYASVPGYILRWHYTRNEAGLPVSEVTPVDDATERDAIRQLVVAEAGEQLRVEFS
jgi:hypothetical protein